MDTPIKQLMPDFEVSDKQAEGQWTCADIYSHMTGLSGYELVFEEGMSVKQALDSLQVLRPNVPFRSRFQYSNLPFNIIDRLVTHLSGKAFPAYVKEHVLDPIGLSSTVYKEDDLVPKGWWKTYGPDVDFEGGYQMKETGFVAGQCKALRAPGGSLMSGEDLLKWIECLPKHPIYHLASQPRVQLGQGFHSHSYPYEAATYGLATAQTTYNKSHRVVEHVGNASGYRAFVMDLPDLGIRIGMMSNASPSEPGAGFRDWLRSRLLGHFTEESVCGANEALLSQIQAAETRAMRQDMADLRSITGTVDRPLIGKYTCPGVTTWQITPEDNGTSLSDLQRLPWASRTFGPQRPMFTCTKSERGPGGSTEYAGCLEVLIESSGEIMRGSPFTAHLAGGCRKLLVWGLNALEKGLDDKEHPLFFYRRDGM